ncbi:TetR/AcrR family transcriptional regulator [Bacillus sp. DJP31]|uniref:TetR/AcrR family transcriptional regulator n=1 Tax=Bacillus sp. DJP31 TaxID=3409789 RepID=UPI003BB5744D
MTGLPKLKDRKRKSIKQAAFTLFSEYGLKDVKITDIAKLANVSQVTIYNHFENKEQLFRETLIDYTNRKFEEYQGLLLNTSIPFQERIEQYILDKIKSAEEIYPDIIETALVKDDELRSFLQHFSQTKAIPLFVQFIKEGQDTGKINSELSLEVILFYLQMLSNEASTYSKIVTNGNTFAKELLHMFFYGLIGK